MFTQFLYRISFMVGRAVKVDHTWATSDAHAQELFHEHNQHEVVKVEKVLS